MAVVYVHGEGMQDLEARLKGVLSDTMLHCAYAIRWLCYGGEASRARSIHVLDILSTQLPTCERVLTDQNSRQGSLCRILKPSVPCPDE